MTMNHFSLEVFAREHQRELIEEARRGHLAHAASRAASRQSVPRQKARRASALASVRARIGRALIAAGRRLESRAAGPAVVTCVVCGEHGASAS
jgi:hypothetical protein